MSTKICPIDNHPMKYVFTSKVLSKYDVSYFQCSHCQLLQTEKTYWLEEAYGSAYSITDTGVLARCLHNRRRLEPILELLFKCNGLFVDVGGGSGVLARLMRDIGIDFYTSDKYSENIFARSFDAPSPCTASALTAFEILEHLEDPREFLADIFELYSCDTLIFSTTTFSQVPPLSWPYYDFPNGQHISFYHKSSLEQLAESVGCYYLHLFSDIHLISNLRLGFLKKKMIQSRELLVVFALLTRLRRFRESFTTCDSLELLNKH